MQTSTCWQSHLFSTVLPDLRGDANLSREREHRRLRSAGAGRGDEEKRVGGPAAAPGASGGWGRWEAAPGSHWLSGRPSSPGRPRAWGKAASPSAGKRRRPPPPRRHGRVHAAAEQPGANPPPKPAGQRHQVTGSVAPGPGDGAPFAACLL